MAVKKASDPGEGRDARLTQLVDQVIKEGMASKAYQAFASELASSPEHLQVMSTRQAFVTTISYTNSKINLLCNGTGTIAADLARIERDLGKLVRDLAALGQKPSKPGPRKAASAPGKRVAAPAPRATRSASSRKSS